MVLEFPGEIILLGNANLSDYGGITMEFEGYCVKCKTKRTISNGEVVTTKNGRRMAKGKCGVCGTTVNKFLPKE